VHEAYLRLASPAREGGEAQRFNSRGHFFAACAEAMRRILVENARRHRAEKRGGGYDRIDLPELADCSGDDPLDLLALDDALKKLEEQHPQKAQVVKLRFFAGRSLEETAELLGIARATAQRHWAAARAWLFGQLNPD
jgi:RNA polymerase sigma factor (TIGR02999 family)